MAAIYNPSYLDGSVHRGPFAPWTIITRQDYTPGLYTTMWVTHKCDVNEKPDIEEYTPFGAFFFFLIY